MRAHHTQVVLAKKLQSLGFPVMRFDYSGTGDSSGSIQTLARWREETLVVVDAFKRRTGVQRVSLVGTRLGGTIAIQASYEVGFKRLLLWDPVTSGPDYLQAFEKAHHRLLHRVPDEAPHASNQKFTDQSCGYPWPLSIQQEIALISPNSLNTFCKKVQIVSSDTSKSLASMVDRWKGEGIDVVSRQPGEDLKWAHDLYLTHRVLAPSSLRLLAQYAEER